MGTEIERKFIVEAMPPDEAFGAGVRIRQGYLCHEGDVEVRVRIADDGSTLTVKAGGGVARTEVESVIAIDDAESLWPHTEGRRIDKVRHRIALGPDHVAELDVYEGSLSGLVVVEVEFESGSASNEFDPPPWFGRELTGSPEWSNARLARHGLPS